MNINCWWALSQILLPPLVRAVWRARSLVRDPLVACVIYQSKNSLKTIKNLFDLYPYCDQNCKAILCLCNMHQEHLGSHHPNFDWQRADTKTDACQLDWKHSRPILEDWKTLWRAVLKKAKRRRQISSNHFLFQTKCI